MKSGNDNDLTFEGLNVKDVRKILFFECQEDKIINRNTQLVELKIRENGGENE